MDTVQVITGREVHLYGVWTPKFKHSKTTQFLLASSNWAQTVNFKLKYYASSETYLLSIWALVRNPPPSCVSLTVGCWSNCVSCRPKLRGSNLVYCLVWVPLKNKKVLSHIVIECQQKICVCCPKVCEYFFMFVAFPSLIVVEYQCQQKICQCIRPKVWEDRFTAKISSRYVIVVTSHHKCYAWHWGPKTKESVWSRIVISSQQNVSSDVGYKYESLFLWLWKTLPSFWAWEYIFGSCESPQLHDTTAQCCERCK